LSTSGISAGVDAAQTAVAGPRPGLLADAGVDAGVAELCWITRPGAPAVS